MNSEIESLLPQPVSGETLYVADENLQVIYTNDQWSRFATDNQGTELLGPEWNSNLLDNMSGKQRDRWAAIYGLLLRGELSHYEEDFVCSSPDERRIYRLRSTPVRTRSGDTVLIHHTVRIDDTAMERHAMRTRLQSLGTDPGTVEREYSARVVDQKVDVAGYRASHRLTPLQDVGGDVLWHRRYEEGITDLILADVMGHGIEAGIHAAKMVMMLESLAASHREPQDILASLNRGMLRHRLEHESAFATGILFRFREDSSLVRCANFGHHAPIFSRSGEVDLDSGLALGIADTIPVWPETEIDLRDHGERFLVFSDGITEQFDERGEMFGTERLVRAMQRSLDLDLDAMLQQILDDLKIFRGEAVAKDDLTMIALERI